MEHKRYDVRRGLSLARRPPLVLALRCGGSVLFIDNTLGSSIHPLMARYVRLEGDNNGCGAPF